MAGIYLHIPFCKQACTYCDFHFSTNLAKKGDFVSALNSEIRQRKGYLNGATIESVYFGGGTPSLLSEAELNAILQTIRQHFDILDKAEITLETNPDDIRQDTLLAWRQLGINRLSIGLQSFNEDELRWMNRAHTAKESQSAVIMAQTAGFDNITIDLIYGSRFQTMHSWQHSVETAINLGVQHISAYQLTVEDRTKLGVQVKTGIEPMPSEGLASDQFLYLSERLAAAGFEHYEISNFALPGHRAVHNSNYWKQANYLGVGPSAHSFNGKSRQWNVRSNAGYVRSLRAGTLPFECEELSLRDLFNEYVMTRFRTSWGCDVNEIRTRFGYETGEHFLQMAEEYRNDLDVENAVYTLKKNARLRADGIASAFFILEKAAD